MSNILSIRQLKTQLKHLQVKYEHLQSRISTLSITVDEEKESKRVSDDRDQEMIPAETQPVSQPEEGNSTDKGEEIPVSDPFSEVVPKPVLEPLSEIKPISTDKEEAEPPEEPQDEKREQKEEEQPSPLISRKPKKKPRTRVEWELLIGGRWLNRLGALAIVIGLIFFIKYAFDHQLMNDQMKVALVTIIGLFFLWGGRWFHRKKLPIFGQGLIGTGVATLYLSVYAAHNVYHLVGSNIFIMIMSIVTIWAFWLALSYHSLAISLLGWAGGYLTPFLVTVNEASTVGLFSYLALLSFGMIWIAIKKHTWSILYHLTLIATYLIFFLYRMIHSHSTEWLLYIGFLILFWLIFYMYELFYLLRKNQSQLAKEITAVLHAFFLFGGIVLILAPTKASWLTASLVIAGVFYLIPLFVLSKKGKLSNVSKGQLIRYTFTFCVLFNIAPLYHWEQHELVLAWTLEAAILMWWATRYQLRWLSVYTTSFLMIISLTLCFLTLVVTGLTPVINIQLLTFLVLVGVHLFGAARQPEKKMIYHVLHVSWAGLLLIALNQELSLIYYSLLDRFDSVRLVDAFDLARAKLSYIYGVAIFACWILYSLLLTRISIWKKIMSLTYTSWTILGFGVIGLILSAMDGMTEIFPTIFWVRLVVFLLAMGVLYLNYRWVRTEKPKLALSFLLGLIILGFEFITIQILGLFSYQMTSADHEQMITLDYVRFVSLYTAWILYSWPMFWYGLKRKIPLLSKVAIGLFAFSVIAVMFGGISFTPLSAFIPVWNVRFLMILIAAVVSYCFYLLYRSYTQKKGFAFLLLVFVLLFELTNVEINDFFKKQLIELNTMNTDVQVLAHTELTFHQPIIFAILWLLFSLPLRWLGARFKNQAVIYTSQAVLGISLVFSMLLGFSFSPIESFIPLINLRSLLMLLAAMVVFVHLMWSKDKENIRRIYAVVIVLLLFELISSEVNDMFNLLIFKQGQDAYHWLNIKQLSFSFSWIVYAFILLGLGIWKRFPMLRWIAIGLIGMSTLKIFIFDLAFLGTLYRIILFIGFGLILLGVSFIYQRYREWFMANKD